MPVEEQIADELEKLGYHTETNLGEGADRISVAVYDKKSDKYVLGLQLDKEVMEASSNALERDVFGTQVLTRHGWEVMRVWSRDWWHDRKSVISSIIERLNG